MFKTPLKKINLTGLGNLKDINLSYNELTSVDFLSQLPRPEKLEFLELSRNNFASTTLDFAAPFINLKALTLGTKKEKVQEGVYNRFYGSLEPLKNLTQLGLLCVANTDVDSGLEYLLLKDYKDKSGKRSLAIDCRSQFPNFKVKALKNQLKPFSYDV